MTSRTCKVEMVVKESYVERACDLWVDLRSSPGADMVVTAGIGTAGWIKGEPVVGVEICHRHHIFLANEARELAQVIKDSLRDATKEDDGFRKIDTLLVDALLRGALEADKRCKRLN